MSFSSYYTGEGAVLPLRKYALLASLGLKAGYNARVAASVNIIYATTSGHTSHVVDALVSFLKEKKPDLSIEKRLAEQATKEDLQKGDVLLLAASTWNTGSVEGQLNPHMFTFLKDTAKDANLNGKKTAMIGLGDSRYFFTCRAADELEEFVRTHGGKELLPSLRIINEPYGQEKAVEEWGAKFLSAMNA